MIKVAVIAPIPLLTKYASQSDNYHLLLSNLFHSPEYVNFYRERSEAGDFILLDNSAHELGHGEGFDELERKILQVQPSEVVVPDRLFFGEDTLENAMEFIPQFRDKFGQSIKLLGVPQGRTLEEWTDCLEGLLKLGVNSIGISKDYEVWPGGLQDLAWEVDSVARQTHHLRDEDVQIHMLGWGRDLHQITTFEQFNSESTCSCIRGVDSAKPLVFAEAGINLNKELLVLKKKSVKYPKRPGKFFDFTEGEISSSLGDLNIQVMKDLVSGNVMKNPSYNQHFEDTTPLL